MYEAGHFGRRATRRILAEPQPDRLARGSRELDVLRVAADVELALQTEIAERRECRVRERDQSRAFCYSGELETTCTVGPSDRAIERYDRSSQRRVRDAVIDDAR